VWAAVRTRVGEIKNPVPTFFNYFSLSAAMREPMQLFGKLYRFGGLTTDH